MKRAVLALALAACTYNTTNNYGPQPDARAATGDGGPPDAAPASDPSCGAPLPTTAPDTILISGVIQTIGGSGQANAAGATVELLRLNGQQVAIATADAAGNYTLTVHTGGVPVDGYLYAHLAGWKDTYQFPAVPYDATATGVSLIVVDSNYYGYLAGVGTVAQDPGDALFMAAVTDCSRQPLAGATLTVSPPGDAVIYYWNGTTTTTTATDSNGTAIIKNVTPGVVRIDGEPSLHGHDVAARGDALTLVWMSP